MKTSGIFFVHVILLLVMNTAGRSNPETTNNLDEQYAVKKPNILFIMTDEQYAGMMSCTGNPYLKTPSLDNLASRGMRFERAYSPNPVCIPSRTSMMTGYYPLAGQWPRYHDYQYVHKQNQWLL